MARMNGTMSSERIANTAYWVGDRLGNRFLSPPSRALGYYTNHGPRDTRRIALTFDDGPCRGSTEELLDTMAVLDVRGTFFCVGVNVETNPDVLRRIESDGHTIGNHSYRHSRRAGLSPRNRDHIERGETAIVDVLGKAPRLYRPPWGWLVPWEGRRLRQLGYTIVGWDVYTVDWQIPEPDAAEVAASAIRDTRPGSIFALHDAFPLKMSWSKTVTVDAVRRIVPALRAQGYEFVTVDELLGVEPYAERRPARR